jgi:hypothetical protein
VRAGHAHGPGAGSDRRYLLIALALLASFMLAEVITAVISGSLALLSDAGHMLSDVGAIAAALCPGRRALDRHEMAAFWASERPTPGHCAGYGEVDEREPHFGDLPGRVDGSVGRTASSPRFNLFSHDALPRRVCSLPA